MTAYEMADLAQSNFSNSLAAMALYHTLVFAYPAAAYLIGRDLTHSQVTMLNAVFLTFALINTFGITAYTNAAVKIANQSGVTFDLGLFAPKPRVAPSIGIFCLLGIMICLKFMWDLRRPK